MMVATENPYGESREVEPTTRERILDATVRLLACHGARGVGIKAICASAGVPYGSLYHHFPEGKDALVAAGMQHAGRQRERALSSLMDEHHTLSAAVGEFFDATIVSTETMSDTPGCPVGSPVADGSDSLAIRQAGSTVFDAWQRVIATRARADGMPDDRAEVLASALVALYEGALLLSRAAGDAAALRHAGTAARQLVRSVHESSR